MQWALVDSNNIVDSLIVYDGTSAYAVGAGMTLQQVNTWVRQGENIDVAKPPANIGPAPNMP